MDFVWDKEEAGVYIIMRKGDVVVWLYSRRCGVVFAWNFDARIMALCYERGA